MSTVAANLKNSLRIGLNKGKTFWFEGVGKIILYIVIILSSFLMVLPFLWMLSSSLKPDLEVFNYPIQWIPNHPIWNNYKYIWEKANYFTLFYNSTKLTSIITFLQLITCSMAAYAFAKIEFPEREKLFLVYLGTLMVPFQVIMIPQFIIMKNLHLVDTHLALILVQAFSPFGVFMLKQFYTSIPNEMLEAARIDGLNEFGIYAKIILPLSKPALAALAIFTSVQVWNDFLAPLIYINSKNLFTIQLGLRSLISEYTAEYGPIMAASVVSLIPILIIFSFCQKFFEEGIAMTGLKG
jgi:multiple sugar transport system permease protein